MNIVISSGHGKYIRGASGYLDEVDEARKVVDQVADLLRQMDIGVQTFHDDVSRSQSENLSNIVSFHNNQKRDLDVSVHFNAYQTTNSPMGVECLYVTQQTLADVVSSGIADAGHFIDRGPKKRTDLYFLNNTEMPAILIETCFVDSRADADLYHEYFPAICQAIAEGITGRKLEEPDQPPEQPPVEEVAVVKITVNSTGPVKVVVDDGTTEPRSVPSPYE